MTGIYGDFSVNHTGPGDIYVSLGERRRSPLRCADDELTWLAARFVPPRGFGRARETLQVHRTVLLDGPAGSGRRTAAQMLLHELEEGRFHELLPEDWQDNRDIVGPGDRVWLNLSDVEDELWAGNHETLSALRASVRDRSAFLIVILPDSIVLDPFLSEFRVRIERPSQSVVLRRYLALDHIPQPAPSEDLNLEFLRIDRSMDAIAKHAEAIVSVWLQKHGTGALSAWSSAAERIGPVHEAAVATEVARLSGASERALLLTTAMMHGAHADPIYHAAESLLEKAGLPSGERSLLTEDALDVRLKSIGARIGPAGTVSFEKPAYDMDVRAYFWAHMPQLRRDIREWAVTIIDSPGLTDTDREEFVRRYAEQCLDARYRTDWAGFVEKLTSSWNRERLTAAARVLQRGLEDESSSRTFRRQIYAWSTDRALTAPRAEVLVAACRDEIALTHPDEALVRLHHVARREPQSSARQALLELSWRDRRLFRLMLSRIGTTSSEDFQRFDATLFLDLTDPSMLTDGAFVSENDISDLLVGGWRLTFSELPYEKWQNYAARWLWDPADRRDDTLMKIIIATAETHMETLSQVYASARTRELRDRIMREINGAQGGGS